MPRKKPEELKSGGSTQAPARQSVVLEPAQEISAPVIPSQPQPSAPAPSLYHPADVNGDGIVSAAELAMELEFRRKALEDQDAMRDAQRSMAWFALGGMLLYPFAVVLAVFLNLESAGVILGNMAATYFVSVAAIVAAFFGGQAFAQSKAAKR